uniref:Predicted protein n=1 Tax=Hordeum vulgare subsp. vulgare TaxID=112509 RepID=F2EBB2_HORVV|nr:predicted protein [Hordeum vulgare subsp. vulgare]
MEAEAEMEAEAKGKSIGEGVEQAAGTQRIRDRVAEMEGKVNGKSAESESRKGIEHAARRKHEKSLLEVKSATNKVAAELNLTRIKLETKIKLDEIEEARETDEAPIEAVKGAMGSDELPERFSTSADTKLEIEQAKKMGKEGVERDVVAKLEIEEAEGMEEKMQTEQFFDIYCRSLESTLSRMFSSPCKDATSLSPMHFTHSTTYRTSYAGFATSTLQIYSIKVAEIKGIPELKWPLRVYGMIAARDTVDHNRNILFLRQRNVCQKLTPENPFLQLTGPSRAIAVIDPVEFDIKLKVKGRMKSEDRVLMHQTFKYSCNEAIMLNDSCKIVLRCAKLEKTVQATVVGVRVINWRKRKWPFRHGGLVIAKAHSKPNKPENEAVLLDQVMDDSSDGYFEGEVSCVGDRSSELKHEDEVVLQGQVTANNWDGCLDLSRHVVSVELDGKLEVIIRALSSNGLVTKHGHVFFPAQESKISRAICDLASYKVEVTVAWSLLVRDKQFISREECMDDVQA